MRRYVVAFDGPISGTKTFRIERRARRLAARLRAAGFTVALARHDRRGVHFVGVELVDDGPRPFHR